nr:hypothetical protein [Tanacetum cinerariifolium]
MTSSFRSNMDYACAIARSIFVINFPDSTSSKDLWKLCQSYGTVVDVYIPNRRSKAGKRFAFVRFIKVDNVDRLVGNLLPRPSQPVRKATHTGNTFASVVKGNLVSPMSLSPALVLDDTCLEDFLSMRTVYLGGLWVMIKLNSPETKNKLMNH